VTLTHLPSLHQAARMACSPPRWISCITPTSCAGLNAETSRKEVPSVESTLLRGVGTLLVVWGRRRKRKRRERACYSPGPSLRSVGNGLGSGRDFRALVGVGRRRVPTAGSGLGRVSRPRGSAWALRCRAFSGSPRARG
jgi:hypothetical protein